jgi:hypothetical protein
MPFESPSDRFWLRLKRFVFFHPLDSYHLARTTWYAVLFVTTLKIALQVIQAISLIHSESERLSSTPLGIRQPNFIFNTAWGTLESIMNTVVYLLFVRLLLDVALRLLAHRGSALPPEDGT